MQKILVIDNYDSFTYNLVHIIEKITHQKVVVFRNDAIELEAVDEYEKIILSPGPGLPQEAGIIIPLIQKYSATKSILGVCLGHQAIAVAMGATLHNLQTVFHGMASPIDIVHPSSKIFKQIESPMLVGRYHSWVVQSESMPDSLIVTALDREKNVMAFQHKTFDLTAVQFHPESVLTPMGEQLMRNWLVDR